MNPCYPETAPSKLGPGLGGSKSPMTESKRRDRTERADRWPSRWVRVPVFGGDEGPSGHAAVAAQQTAESFVDDHLAVLLALGGARGRDGSASSRVGPTA